MLPTTSWAEQNRYVIEMNFDLPNDTYFDQSWRDLNYAQVGPCVSPGSGVQDFDMDTAEAWTVTTGDASISAPVPAGTTGVAVWLHAMDVGSLTFTNGLAEVIG